MSNLKRAELGVKTAQKHLSGKPGGNFPALLPNLPCFFLLFVVFIAALGYNKGYFFWKNGGVV
jgi:hypothetical protein